MGNKIGFWEKLKRDRNFSSANGCSEKGGWYAGVGHYPPLTNMPDDLFVGADGFFGTAFEWANPLKPFEVIKDVASGQPIKQAVLGGGTKPATTPNALPNMGGGTSPMDFPPPPPVPAPSGDSSKVQGGGMSKGLIIGLSVAGVLVVGTLITILVVRSKRAAVVAK